MSIFSKLTNNFNLEFLYKRFLAASVSFFALAVYLTITIIREPENFSEFESRLMIFLVLAPGMAIAIRMIVEGFKLDIVFEACANATGALLLLTLALIIGPVNDNGNFSTELTYRVSAISIIFFTFILVGGYLGKSHQKIENQNIWKFAERIIFNYAISFGFMSIVFAGTTAALLAIDSLLGATIDGKVYGIFAVWTYTFFVNIFTLASIPRDLSAEETEQSYPKLYKILAQYILIPLVTVYTAILYAYGIKILVSGEWPENQIAYLILGFLFPGFLAILILYPFSYFQSEKWFGYYKRIFAASTLPLMLMLFLALRIRVNEYGWTIDRLVVGIFGIWITLIAIYFIIIRDAKLKLIILSVAVFIIISTFTPFLNIFSTAERSQINRLKDILVKEEILNNDKIQKVSESSVGKENISKINNILEYLEETHGLNGIKDWFSDSQWAKFDLDENGQTDKYGIVNDIMSTMGITYDGYNRFYSDTRYFSLVANPSDSFDIKGFSELYNFKLSNLKDNEFKLKSGKVLSFDTLDNNFKLKISVDGKTIANIDLEEPIEKSVEDYEDVYLEEAQTSGAYITQPSLFQFEVDLDKNTKALIYIDSINGMIEKDSKSVNQLEQIYGGSGFVVVE